MKFIIPIAVLLVNILSNTLAVAGCTNLNSRVNITRPDNMYTDHGDGTVTDNNTGLMWQKCSLGLSGATCSTGTQQKHTWQTALAAANASTDSGYSDWRLPNKNELVSLVEYACSLPAINETIFPSGSIIANAYGNFWTSTPLVDIGNVVWYVNFQSGGLTITNATKDDLYFVRLVRGL